VTSVALLADQLFAAVPGGIGTYVRELLPALREADPTLDLTVFHARQERPAPLAELDGIPRVELARGIRSLYPGWNLVGRPALPPSLGGAGVLHAPSPVAVPPARPGQRLVVTVHDLAFRLYPSLFPPAWRAMYRAGLRRAARHADAIVAISRHTARDLARHARVEPRRIHVIPLAASIPETAGDPEPVLQRLKVPRPYLLFAGTLEPRKNLVRMVRAYRRIAVRLPHTLVLAGPAGWRTQRLHRELSLRGPGRVLLTGRVSASDLDALYRGAAAFCYPSLYEGFGLPVLEAMARGVPTVIADASSLPEVAGDAALRANPRSVRSLAEAVERILTDRHEADRLAEAGPGRASMFSWDQTARMTLRVYEGAA
jgi:glycosyltransferase involved in cell wall biosynthesis